MFTNRHGGTECPKPTPKLLAKQKAKKDETREWLKVRKFVLSRDGHCCRACGSSHGLEVHHVVFRSLGGRDEASNLVALCDDCHRSVHGHILKIRPLYPTRPQYHCRFEWVK